MQVLAILLRNAVTRVNEENGKISLAIDKLEETDKATSLRFEVSDNGVGMTLNKLNELKEIFSPDQNKIHYNSNEIMLSACSSIVKAFGSQIMVESKSDEGLCLSFSINFPKALALPETLNQIEKPLEHPVAGMGKGSFSGKRVLIVDDVKVNRTVLSNILKKEGMEIIEAKDGQDAVDKFMKETNHFDLILMDIMMPKMDGYEAVRKIRTCGLSNGKTIPIIAVTTKSYQQDKETAINSGMDFHLEKPVEPNLLISTIRRFLA